MIHFSFIEILEREKNILSYCCNLVYQDSGRNTVHDIRNAISVFVLVSSDWVGGGFTCEPVSCNVIFSQSFYINDIGWPLEPNGIRSTGLTSGRSWHGTGLGKARERSR